MINFYKCEKCNNVKFLRTEEVPSCCGVEMTKLVPNALGLEEKHLPYFKALGRNVIAQIGKVMHPMGEDHYIEMIVVEGENENYTKRLKPGQVPLFSVKTKDKPLRIYSLCNLHGLWAVDI